MMQIVLIGIGAGAAAALLFASVASGSLLSILLFYLAPLPILIAALGWSHWAALIAALAGAVGLAAVFGVVLLRRLPGRRRRAGLVARLSRAAGAPGDGRHRRRARMVSGRTPGALGRRSRRADRRRLAIPNFGTDEETFRAALRDALMSVLRAQTGLERPGPGTANDIDRLVDFLVIAVPPAAAVLATVTNADQSLARRTRRESLRPA